MKINRFCLPLLLLIFLVSCKQDNSSEFPGFPEVNTAIETYKTESTPTNGNLVIQKIMAALATDISDDQRNAFLEYGYDIAKTHSITSREAAFLFPIVKANLGQAGNEVKLYDLALLMKKLNKPEASNTIFKGIAENFPNFEKAGEAQTNMTEAIESIDDYITTLGEGIFVNPDNTGINRQASLKYVNACEAYAMIYSDSPNAPDYLFRAAEVAKSIRTFPKSISIYDWIIDAYPNYEKAPTSLFLKGFIIENNLGDDDSAREIYESFIKKYPQHDLADDVGFLIENLGKTDEEILEMIESKRKDKANN